MSVLFRFNGQASYEVDTGTHTKIRVVFGMIDEERKSMAWYLFASDGVKKPSKGNASAPSQFGNRTQGGRDIPHTFKNDIGLEGLAINPKGTSATLDLEVSDKKRFISCRISTLKTKAKEVVTFPFGLQFGSDPPRTDKISGKVLFLELATYDANAFPQGPQGKSRSLVTDPAI